MRRLNAHIFKACDIRGLAGTEITADTAYRIGCAVGLLAKRKLGLESPRIFVGGDVRPSTPELMTAAIEGLLASGCSAVDLGVVPTPAFYFALEAMEADGGIMVTASHNPAPFNGFKLRVGRMPITPEEIEEVHRLAETASPTGVRIGSAVRIDVLPAYEEHVLSTAPAPKPLSVVVDCSNGCYSGIAPNLLRRLGMQVHELFCMPDGTFPGHPPNPAVVSNLSALCQKVKEAGADLGVAFDGDGDRVAFVDSRGRPVTADTAAVIFIRNILHGSAGRKVVYDLKCSMAVEEAIRQVGCVPLMERSGHTFIKTRMLLEKAVFGAEISGHFFYEKLWGGDDGLFSALVMMDLVGRVAPLAELADAVPTYSITPDLRIPAEGLNVPEVLERLKSAAEGDVSLLDGLRVVYPEGWALFRPSVTEPAVTLRFETRRPEDLRVVVQRFLAPTPELQQRVFDALEKAGL
ncbi:MAG: phosphomannomutase/phosphoglucomutase [Armatimonadota bacterium]